MAGYFVGSSRFPKRMNETFIRIKPLSRRRSNNLELLDEDFQEPTGPYQYMNAIELEGQVVFYSYEKNSPKFSGDGKMIIGHLVFRTKNLQDKLDSYGLNKLNNGDIIIQIENVDCEYEISEVRPTAMLKGGSRYATAMTTTVYFTEYKEVLNASSRPI